MAVVNRPTQDTGAPERWSVDAGGADLATLEIAPSATRRRVFAIDSRLAVRAGAAARSPWVEMRVELDGALEWSRRAPVHGDADTIDHHCRRVVDIGRPLKIRVVTRVGAAHRVRLSIDAEEQR